MKRVSVHVDWMQVFLIINNVRMMINVGRCECKELVDKSVCDKGHAWNPSNCECECDKSWDVDEYLGYENCKFRKRLLDKLVEESSENIEEAKLTEKTLFEHVNEYLCSYAVFVVLVVIALTICIWIGAYFA